MPGGPHRRIEREVAAGDATPQRTALADEVLLPDELVEDPRAHARGERLRSGGGWKSASGRAPPGFVRVVGIRPV